MIDEIFGKQLLLHEQVLLVADSQREVVEAVLRRCNCKGEWSRAVSAVETFNNLDEGSGVSVWALSLACREDAKTVQSALDAIE